jgi:hypothetical protein
VSVTFAFLPAQYSFELQSNTSSCCRVLFWKYLGIPAEHRELLPPTVPGVRRVQAFYQGNAAHFGRVFGKVSSVDVYSIADLKSSQNCQSLHPGFHSVPIDPSARPKQSTITQPGMHAGKLPYELPFPVLLTS